jgi:flagellar biosynthesis protein FlhB
VADERDDTERSEDPTQKRLDEALKRGDVVKSQEVNTWFIIAAATLILMAFSAPMAQGLTTSLRGLIANSYALRVDGRGFLDVVSRLGFEVIAAVAIPLLLLALAAIGANLIQHRLVWSAEALIPKLSKISPGAGFKRLFSKQAMDDIQGQPFLTFRLLFARNQLKSALSVRRCYGRLMCRLISLALAQVPPANMEGRTDGSQTAAAVHR